MCASLQGLVESGERRFLFFLKMPSAANVLIRNLRIERKSQIK